MRHTPPHIGKFGPEISQKSEVTPDSVPSFSTLFVHSCSDCSYFQNHHNESRALSSPCTSLDDGMITRIEVLGPNAERELRMLRMFHEVGREFINGATSLRVIAQIFEEREVLGLHPENLPSTLTSISREIAYARKSFGKRFQLNSHAELFKTAGLGCAITGLTSLGVTAWEMTREFLVRHQIITFDATMSPSHDLKQ